MKRLIISFLVIFVVVNSMAQFTIGKFSGQEIAENAIKGSAIILKQSYQVKNKKNGKVFGRGGHEYFGCSYSVGVKTEAGIILTDASLNPWLYDSAYKKVENEYEPVIYLTESRDVESCGTVFTRSPLEVSRQQLDGVWLANTKDIVSNSIEIDTNGGIKNGWLLWYVAQKDMSVSDTVDISITSINKKIEVSDNATDIDVELPLVKGHILGGMYVCPSFLGGGHVAFKLVGVLVKEENTWRLKVPFVDYFIEKKDINQDSNILDENKTNESAQDEDDQDIDLTPVDQPKDKKKGKKSKK